MMGKQQHVTYLLSCNATAFIVLHDDSIDFVRGVVSVVDYMVVLFWWVPLPLKNKGVS